MRLVVLLLIFVISCKLEAIDLKIPKSSKDNVEYENVLVKIDSNNYYYINGIKIDKDKLEVTLLKEYKSSNEKRLTIKIAKNVKMKHTVFVMDIANRNRIKSSLAVRSK